MLFLRQFHRKHAKPSSSKHVDDGSEKKIHIPKLNVMKNDKNKLSYSSITSRTDEIKTTIDDRKALSDRSHLHIDTKSPSTSGKKHVKKLTKNCKIKTPSRSSSTSPVSSFSVDEYEHNTVSSMDLPIFNDNYESKLSNTYDKMTPFERVMALSSVKPEEQPTQIKQIDKIALYNMSHFKDEKNIYLADILDKNHNYEFLRVIVKKQDFYKKNKISNYRSSHEANIQRFLSDTIFKECEGFDYIVSFVDQYIDREFNLHFLIMEHCAFGTLLDLVIDKPAVSSSHILKQLFHDVSKGINYMHCRNIAHRDIKLENIFLSWSDKECRIVAKIGDFGHACQLSKQTMDNYTLCSIDYAAPELFETNRMHNAFYGDRWSYGVCLFAAFENRYPFNLTQDRNGVYIKPFGFELLKFKEYDFDFNWMENNIQFKNLISNLLRFNPKDRMKFKDVVSHKFFTGKMVPLKKDLIK